MNPSLCINKYFLLEILLANGTKSTPSMAPKGSIPLSKEILMVVSSLTSYFVLMRARDVAEIIVRQ